MNERHDPKDRDPVLDSLGEHLREESRELAAFQRLAHGELGTAELRALEAAAETSPYAARALDLHRPLSPEDQEKLAKSVEKVLGVPAKISPMATVRVQALPPLPSEQRPTGTLLHWKLLAPLAVAAALGLFVFSQRKSEPADLPAYAMVATGGESELRGGETSETKTGSAPPTLRVRPGSRFELLLRPARPTRGDVTARVFLDQGGGPASAGFSEIPAATVETSTEGAVRIKGFVPATATGESSIVGLVGRPAAVKSGLPAQAGASAHRVRLLLIP